MLNNRAKITMVDEHFLMVASTLVWCPCFYEFANQNIDFDSSPLLSWQVKQIVVFPDEIFV